MPGARLNPGGRPRSRAKAFAEAVATSTDDLATLKDLLLKMAGDWEHPDQFKAIAELLKRTLGAHPATSLLDDLGDGEELTEDQLLEAAEKFIAEAKARRKEKTDGGPKEPERVEAVEPGEQAGAAAGGRPAEVGEVPEVGAPPHEEPQPGR